MSKEKSDKKELKSLDDNPWYMLMTLHGEPDSIESGLNDQNRDSWDSSISKMLSHNTNRNYERDLYGRANTYAYENTIKEKKHMICCGKTTKFLMKVCGRI